MTFRGLFSRARLLAAGGFLAAWSALAATPFSGALSPADRSAAGFDHLAAAQVQVLDSLIQRDIDLARQGDVVGFAKTFSQRRTADERVRSGIDRLTPAETARLDALVAAAIASRPATPYAWNPKAAESPQGVGLGRRKPEVHGSFSLVYGAGSHGASWYGGAFDVSVTDPSGRVTTTVGMSQMNGRGFWGPGYCDRGWWIP